MDTAVPLVEIGPWAFVVRAVSEQFLPAIGALGGRVCEHIPCAPNSAFLAKSSSKLTHKPLLVSFQHLQNKLTSQRSYSSRPSSPGGLSCDWLRLHHVRAIEGGR